MNRTRIIQVLAIVLAFGMLLSYGSVSALTQTEVDTVCALFGCDDDQRAALDALVSGGSGGSCPALVQPLTIGSTGQSVTDLQTYLEGEGFFSFAGAKGYFGPITQSAVAAWQSANGVSPAAGYWGPLSLSAYNSVCVPSGSGSGSGSGSSGSSSLSGGAGSVDTYKLSSGLSNEEVGEGEDDVEVAGLEIENSDDSDIMIKAVKVVFAQNSADSKFDKYAKDVSIWFKGDKVGERDADKFTDDNSYTQTITLDSGVIIDSGDTEDLTLAVSGISNLDSNDAGETWTVDFTSIRFEDAQGSIIAEDPGTGTRGFSFENFATSADTKLKITSGSHDINDGRVIVSDATNAVDNVEVFAFDVKIEGSSLVRVDDFSIEASTAGAANFDEIADSIALYVDGDKVHSVSVPANEDTILFDDLNLDLDPGTYEFSFHADLLAVSGDLDDGDTFTFTIGETETDLATTDIDDANGDALADANISGSVTSATSSVHSVAIDVDLVSANALAANNDTAVDDDVGTFTMVFDISALGGTVYVGDTAAGTTVADGSFGVPVTDAIVYRVYDSGTATTDDLADTVTFTTPGGVSDSTDNIKIEDGATSRVTLTVTQTNDSAEDDGIYFMDLAGIGWGIADDTTYEYTYTFDLDDFETNTISLN